MDREYRELDPEERREELRAVLGACGADLTLFSPRDLARLWDARYLSPRALQVATREGLTAAGLPPGIVDHILTLEGPRVFSDITIYIPGGLSAAYIRRRYRQLTSIQFMHRMCREAHWYLMPVDEQPPVLLALRDYAAATLDVDDVGLRDGMQLAVVVRDDQAWRPDDFSRLDYGRQITTLSGWQLGPIAGDEGKALAWAQARLAGDEGASRWSFKHITHRRGGCQAGIEVAGMAYSQHRVVLVVRKPRISLEAVEMLAPATRWFERRMEDGGSSTAMLRDAATGRAKRLEVFLAADGGWAADRGEAAACAVRMRECGIQPLLPTGDGGGYDLVGSCDLWPVDDSTRRRGQEFLAANKPSGLWTVLFSEVGLDEDYADYSAELDAGSGSAGGGAAGPTGAVGSGRHARSQQAAACSPALTHHLTTQRAHDPFSAAGACVRRRVAPARRPARLHLPRQHASLGPGVRRL
ncbi:hypothetical protein HXX76_009504 [Chlamydomonas incerta]|uniref:Uncharacterized protein n=1 Tax=Chlamydomonas incerta TaxID=51695 RepID=A0A835T2X0_CHLIN|nr:hypothetical protein HXX76_009504 [Chlamydomonas incerta]|eukprot:KAG2431490.1 hypothetical protein HXX76_009504 [Chlamydomonas incerta]